MVAFNGRAAEWVESVIEQIIDPQKNKKPVDIFASPQLVLVLNHHDKKNVLQMRPATWVPEESPSLAGAGVMGKLSTVTVLHTTKLRKSVIAIVVGSAVVSTFHYSVKELFNRNLL